MTLAPYDAVLLLSFGGPEAPEDVVPFLRNVTAGRGIPDERLEEVGEHYYHFGGRSPINDQNRALLEALREEMDARDLQVPLAWGNRNWDPYLTDTLRDLHEQGARRVVTVVTSAYGSYSGCRQYRENIAASLATLAEEGRELVVDKVRVYFNDPGFVAANVDAVVDAYANLTGVDEPLEAPLVFVTHSIPTAMEEASGAYAPASYSAQHLEIAGIIAEQAGERLGRRPEWQLSYCSRSGNPATPWLEPDVNDTLTELHARGAVGAVLAPIGFVSDHMEVIYDLDTEARETAEELGLPMARAATVGTHGAFVSGLVELLLDRAATARGEAPRRATVGSAGRWHETCPAQCCLARHGQPTGVPAACQQAPTPA